MAAASSLSTAPRAPLSPALAFFGAPSNRFGAACACFGEPGFSLAEAKTIYVGGRNAWNPWGPGVRKWKGPNKVLKGDTLVFRWKKKSNVVMLGDATDPAAPYYYGKCPTPAPTHAPW
ncbi:unnamed protein product [Closterium sp. Naga37s-1]|nr:unnamed protein product [Closterium sp. Naga37s-1]